MENEARFDLNKALQDWKAELAAQPGITAENIRELETHLLESFNAFRKSGCSDEDAFSKARQKLGSVSQLGTEFAKENLLKIWRDRVFWITAIAFLFQLIGPATHPLFRKLAHPVSAALGLSQWWIVLALLATIPPLLVAIAMATGFAEILFRRFHWIFSHRWRLAVAGVIAILATVLAAFNSPDLRGSLPDAVITAFAFLGFSVFIWPRELAIVSATTGSTLRRNSISLWRDRFFWAVLALLAIRVWTLVPSIGALELIRFNGRTVLAHWWFPVAFESLLFLPIAVVGLMLASARLSALAQWLRTRSRVGFIAGILTLIWVAQVFWVWPWALSTLNYPSTADLNLAFQRELLTGIIVPVGLIAITLWTMPSRVAQRPDDALQFE